MGFGGEDRSLRLPRRRAHLQRGWWPGNGAPMPMQRRSLSALIYPRRRVAGRRAIEPCGEV
jgi:hypothetical protein